MHEQRFGKALSAAEINIGASAIRNALASRQRVPDEIRRLPKMLRSHASAIDDGDFIGDYNRGRADQANSAAELIERAIAESGEHYE